MTLGKPRAPEASRSVKFVPYYISELSFSKSPQNILFIIGMCSLASHIGANCLPYIFETPVCYDNIRVCLPCRSYKCFYSMRFNLVITVKESDKRPADLLKPSVSRG